ncbi:MAG: sulfite exporter TauE/SafE family protein [Clostridia bacterium]|nr:sulfite exporter TauE/SafE family protein [Clostridia bacterium]
MVDIIAACVCGVLSGMGVGSGGLFMIYLLLVRDVPQLTAQGLNLLFFLFSAGASLPVNLKKHRPSVRALAVLCIFGIAGTYLGTRLGGALDARVLKKCFGALIAVSGIAGLLSSSNKKTGSRE